MATFGAVAVRRRSVVKLLRFAVTTGTEVHWLYVCPAVEIGERTYNTTAFGAYFGRSFYDISVGYLSADVLVEFPGNRTLLSLSGFERGRPN